MYVTCDRRMYLTCDGKKEVKGVKEKGGENPLDKFRSCDLRIISHNHPQDVPTTNMGESGKLKGRRRCLRRSASELQGVK